jgi:hypothetical protein
LSTSSDMLSKSYFLCWQNWPVFYIFTKRFFKHSTPCFCFNLHFPFMYVYIYLIYFTTNI